MKTTARQNRRTRFAVTACAALILTTLSWAQPGPFRHDSRVNNPLDRFAYETGQVELALVHEIPAFSKSAAIAMYKARLDMWAVETAEMLKYKAPSNEALEVRQAYAGLEASASVAVQSLRYEAPAIENVEAVEARQKIDVFAGNCLKKLRYVAPSVEATEARQKISVFSDRCIENLRYMPPSLETVEMDEARKNLEIFAAKMLREMIDYEPIRPSVFAFEYERPASGQVVSGKYLTVNPE